MQMFKTVTLHRISTNKQLQDIKIPICCKKHLYPIKMTFKSTFSFASLPCPKYKTKKVLNLTISL